MVGDQRETAREVSLISVGFTSPALGPLSPKCGHEGLHQVHENYFINYSISL